VPNYSLDIYRASIVLLGRFNPVIFHPAWFARYGLLRDQEADNVTGVQVTEQGTKFKIEWCEIEVVTERFHAFTEDPSHFVALRDLIVSTLSLLEHTPVWALGMNGHLHYKLETVERWHQFGHLLAPKAHWQKIVTNPGMLGITIQGTRPDVSDARIQWRVEPSRRVHPGVYVAVNQHHEIPRDDDSGSKKELVESPDRRRLFEALSSGWDSLQAYARTGAESLLNEVY
jgi:hypothetical protein